MKLITGILAAAMMAGAVQAQNPNIINNVKGKMDSIQQQKTNDSNAALDVAGVPATGQAAKPAPGAATTAQSHAVPATTAAKSHDIFVPKKPGSATSVKKLAVQAKVATKKAPTTKIVAVEAKDDSARAEAPKALKPEEKKWAMSGKRDPFFSPIVVQVSGSGCSTGKKCLEIGQINVRGVVKSDNGFIAVVTNSINKAYFLHENDPVFNGYVVRITGDSVVFQETVQDKLGKSLTREVVKRIVTPAV